MSSDRDSTVTFEQWAYNTKRDFWSTVLQIATKDKVLKALKRVNIWVKSASIGDIVSVEILVLVEPQVDADVSTM